VSLASTTALAGDNGTLIIRASSLTTYADCNRRGAARIFGGIIKDAGYQLRQLDHGIGAVIGVSVHGASAGMLKEKLSTGNLPPKSVSADMAMEILREEIKLGVTYDGKVTPERSVAEQQVLRMTESFRTLVAPEIQPRVIEERLEAQVTDTLVLTGQPDMIAMEPDTIDDLKTGTKAGNHAPQLGAYSLLARSNGLPIHKAKITWVPRAPLMKSRKPYPQPAPQNFVYDLAVAETAAINVLRHMEADLRVFQHGDPDRNLMPGDQWAFMPNPMSVLCSEKWCPAWGTEFCRDHAAIIKEEDDFPA